MILCLIVGMKKCIVKPVSYDKIKEVTQDWGENRALFQGWPVEAFWRFTNTDPSSPKGRSLLSHHFTTQSAPDIRRKHQKLQYGPQTLLAQLLDMAFGVSNNRDQAEEDRRTRHVRPDRLRGRLK